MFLAFAVPVILFELVASSKKKLSRGNWYILFSVGLVLTLILSFVAVWSAWDPNAMSDSLHDGNYPGTSVLSFPIWLNVYITPARERIVQGAYVTGNVSFTVFIVNGKVLETDGALRYAAIMGSAPVEYQLGPPFFSDVNALFRFLLFLFTLLNTVGFALGLTLCHVLSRKLRLHVSTPTAQNRNAFVEGATVSFVSSRSIDRSGP